MRKIATVFTLGAFLFGIFTLPLEAAVPKLLTYHGLLKDAANSYLTGTYSMTFRVYDAAAAGKELWKETHSSVSVTSGRFSVILGSVTALGLSFGQDYWVSVQVGTDSEMVPRQRITSVGYAAMAEDVTGGKLTATAHAEDSHMAISGVKSAHTNIAKTNFKLDAYTKATANSMGDLIVDTFSDAKGIDSAKSKDYQWRGNPDYDVTVASSDSDATGSGSVSASSAWDSRFDPAYVVDNNTETGWLSAAVPSASQPQWWQYDFGAAKEKVVVKYTIQHATDGNPPYYYPKSFTLQGSNDGSGWTTVHSPSAQTGWGRLEKRTFTFSNSTAYRYYRIHITEKEAGGEGVSMGEVELIPAASGSAGVVSVSFSETQVPKEVILVAEETLNKGAIKYHVSRDNGVSWTECAKDKVTNINGQPSGKEVRWKTDISGDAELNAIAVAI